eukprot:CAMPEP_0175044508 /NCGR_PEP_ID=MMETSP0052_2-20121109/3854_1 /TAXON_ID=51329 ORGANISM="Polytomella parva, Strain SAG 63-3" /NCGR_SAMPLE_ID=MMETSP0052_2 /ASSEMBLY_ACC=CAM_ASM_000194 /LENGTH=166 /DNA_ID=CAMNT_0016307831 /DNA_START=924 /DNA_END=1424 /DNA_ORIENTATION=+
MYVLGMDPNRSGGCVTGGLSSERGMKPSIGFNLSRNEYFDKAGVYNARRRLEWYTFDNGYNELINSITTAKTSHLTAALERLATFSIVSEVLFKGYRYLQEKSEQSVFEKIPINENTYVLGMDSNKPSGCVAGGLSSKRGVKLSINFNLLRNKYFDKAGVSDAHRR